MSNNRTYVLNVAEIHTQTTAVKKANLTVVVLFKHRN